MKLDFSKGLIPAVVADYKTNEVLMVAYMNEEAFQKTMDTNETWFYSRSRQALWNKGAESGNRQKVVEVLVDCDADALLIMVDPTGPACHTGERSCFYRTIKDSAIYREVESGNGILSSIMADIMTRKSQSDTDSYTHYLFRKGIDKISKKLIEEAGEVIIAAKNNSKEEMINEISDLFYHTLVLMAEREISLKEIGECLEARRKIKGNFKGERPEIQRW